MARVEGGAVIIDTDWPGLKNQIDTRKINFKYEEDATAYEIFAIDGQYFYKTIIYKSGQAPENQATYDTWRSDFESNYKDLITDFTSTQPVFITNVDGYSVVLKDGATPTGNDGYGIAVIASDGSNYRMLKSDTSGRPILVGAGTAGTPAGGVLTIQGAVGGTAIPISGNITASNASVSDNDQAIPLFSNLIGGSDGTNLRPLRVFDVDSGGGQQWVLGVGLRKAAGGGSVELGTSSDPIRTDPTGTTTQPVSGTITANQGGSWTVAATQSGTWTVQPGNTANTTPWLTTISQGGNSATVTASNALKVDGSAVTQPISGTVTANAGTGNFTVVQATASNLRAQLASESSTGTAIPSTAVMVGGSDGTNLRAFFLDTSGRPFIVGAAANGAAVAGNPVLIAGSDGANARSIRTATDGTVRVDPTGTTTQPVSGTVTANAGTGTFTVSGTVTANIGTTNGLALDATLAKLTIAQSAALGSNTQALVGGSVTTAAPTYTTGNINPLSLTTAGALRVDGSGTTQPVSGTVAATQSGTWTVQPGNTANTTPWLTTISQGGNSATVTASNALKVDGSAVTQPVSGTVTSNQGTANTLANRWPVIVTDGTNTMPTGDSVARSIFHQISDGTTGPVAVKAASTAPTVSDKALVVVLSPNQPTIPVSNSPSTSTPAIAAGYVLTSSLTKTAVIASTYIEQTTNAQRSFKSASANDTAAGTGARTLKLTYYDQTMAGPNTETITLNGTTAVNTVNTNIAYIESIVVATAGSGLVNAGIISMFISTGGLGGTLATINAGENKTFWGNHYVASDKICYITGLSGNNTNSSNGSILTLTSFNPTSANSTETQISDFVRVGGGTSQPVRVYNQLIKVPGPARIRLYETCEGTANITTRGAFDYYDI